MRGPTRPSRTAGASFEELLDALTITRWRASLPETMRHGAHRALRQVLRAAVRWRWIEHNVAGDITNRRHARAEFTPFESWGEVEGLAVELGPFGRLAIFCVGTGVRPEEAFGGDWADVDLDGDVFTVRRAFAAPCAAERQGARCARPAAAA